MQFDTLKLLDLFQNRIILLLLCVTWNVIRGFSVSILNSDHRSERRAEREFNIKV